MSTLVLTLRGRENCAYQPGAVLWPRWEGRFSYRGSRLLTTLSGLWADFGGCGRYFGVSKKGRRVQSRFGHFWTIRDGKVARLQQTADTLLIAQALGN
jgi:hypothetical protein